MELGCDVAWCGAELRVSRAHHSARLSLMAPLHGSRGDGPQMLTQISPTVLRRCQEDELDEDADEVVAASRGPETCVRVDRRGSRSRDRRYRSSSLSCSEGSNR